MKKADSRSHSWWWDSHISPKNSKWLQENLTEMDTKVSAMLKIIEEDADSFAQRAEMYYRRRPELINLIEEFYRTYRALVERYNFLTKEIRQNMAPALQAQLGISPESAQNSPIDHVRRGMDGFDIISPSYSYPGPSEFDDDTQSEVSTKSWKGHNDEEESSPLGSATNLESHSFAFRPKFPGLEEESYQRSHFEHGGPHGSADVDISQLQKELQHLQDENKALAAKASEDVSNLKNLQLELSSLQSRMRSLEAEDKMTKKRLKSVLEQEQKLESENLKLSHALILSKEEKTELVELRKKEIEKNNVAGCKIVQLEEEAASIKKELLAAQLQVSVGLEHAKKCEEEIMKVQTALANLLEEKEGDCLSLDGTFEQLIQELQERFFFLKQENGRLKEQIVCGAMEVKRLEGQLLELTNDKENLEQVLVDLRKQIEVLEAERFAAVLKSQELQNELEMSHKDMQNLSSRNLESSEQIVKLEEMIQELQHKCSRLETENMEGSSQVVKLNANTQELQRVRDRLMAECEECKVNCQALQMSEVQLKDQIASLADDKAHLQEQNKVVEVMVANVDRHVKELQQNLATLESEKIALAKQLDNALEQVNVSKIHHRELEMRAEVIQGERDKHKQDLSARSVHVKELEETLRQLTEVKTTLEKRDLEAQQEILELKQKHLQLSEVLGVESALSKSLNDKKLELEKEQAVMASKVQEILTKLALLQEENATLSCNYGKSQADHQSAMEAVRRAEEDLSLSLRELRHLQDEMKAKREQLENEIEAVRKELAESQSISSLLAQDKEDCLKRLADAEAKVSDLNTKLSGLLVAHADLTKEFLEKGRCIEMLKAELSDMCQLKANLEEENTLMAERARVLQERIDNLESAEKVLKLDVGSSLKRSKVLEAEVQQLQQAVSHAEGQNTILTCEQQKVLEESFVMKEKIKDLKEEMDRLLKERNVLFAEVALQTDQSKELKLRLNNLQAEKHALDQEMELSQKQLAKFEDEVMSLGEEKELLAKKLTDTQGQLETLMSCFSDEQGKKVSLANELSETTGQVEALKVQVSDLQKEKAILQEQIDLKSLDAASLVAQIESCNEQESVLHAQLKKMTVVVHSLESELETLRLAASLAKEVTESFAQERNFLNAEVALHTGQCEELKLRLSSLQVEKVAVEHELDLLEKQLANLEKENKALGEGKELLAKKLVDAQAYIMDLEPRLSDSLGKNASLANELSVQAGQVEALKLQLSELQNAKATLQEDVKLKSHDAACLLGQIEVHKEQQSNLQTQLKDKSDLIQSLEVQLEMSKAAASKAEEHKDFLAQEHQRSLDENLFIQKRFEDLQERLGHATQERELLLKEGDLLVEHCNELERSIKILEDEKVGLQKELLQMGSLAEQLKEEVKNLHSEKNQISETLQVELLKVQNTKEDMAKLQLSLRSTLKEQESVMEMLKLRSQEKDALEVQYADLQAESKEIKLETLKAKEEAKNIEVDLTQIRQANIALEVDYNCKLKEITKLQEEVLKLESRKKELEEKLQMDDKQIVLLKDEMNTLQQALALTQDDKERFEEMALQSAAECSSAQKALTDIEEKLDKEVSNHQLLQLEKEEVVASLMVLEKGLAQVQEEKATMTKLLESTQQGLSSLQGEHASLVQASLMQSQEKEEKITSLQQQIKALESQKSVFSETMSKMSLDFVSAEESLKDELAQLKSESCQHEKNLCHQRGLVGQLEAEIQKLRSDSLVLQEYSAIGASRISNIEREVLELQGYNDRLKKQLQDKNTELSRLSESSELLQQSVVLAKQESLQMKESLDCCNAAKEKLAGEYKHFQCEEENWKTKATADAALISELESKISVLVVEKAALADEIAENAEHGFKLQEEVKSLIVANGEMSQKWQTEVAEALRLEAALKACKEEELPALQSELAKVQTENLTLHTLRERESSESLMVDKRMKDFTNEVTHLQEEVSRLEDELAAQTARLVDLEGNLSRLSIENSELAEKIHLQEGQRVELEELLDKSQEENEGLKAHVETGTDRGNDLQAKIENLQLQMDVQHQHDLERYSSTVADLAATKEQNRSLREAVSSEAASVTELRKEVSTLLKEKKALEDAMVLANTQITNSEMEVSKLQGAKQSLSCELDKKNKHVHQLISSFGDVYFMIYKYRSKDLNPTVDENQNAAHQKVTGRQFDPTKVAHVEGTEAEKIRVELLKDSTLWEPASGNMDSVQIEETPALERLFMDGLNGLQKLREEIRDLLEENDSLKSQCLSAWTEFNLILNSSKEWQEKVSRLQQENGHLLVEISSYETEAKLLEDKFASLETENKGIHVALDSTVLEFGKLRGMLSHLQVEGIKLIMLLKEKLGVSNKEMKDLTEEFQRHIEEKGLLEHGLPRPVAEEVAPEVEKVDWTDEHPEMPLLEVRNEVVLSQIQISVEKAELLQYAIEFFRKVMYNFVQKSQCKDVNDREELVTLKTVEDDEPNNQDLCIADADQTELLVNGNAGSLPYHINLGTRLHQAYMDEQLEHDLLELKEGRKQLKEDLEARVVEVKRMQKELEGLQKVLEEGDRADGVSGGSRQQQKWSQKKRRVEARVIKLEKELVEQKQQIVKMHAEYMSGTREEEALAESLEEQVLVLVSQEIAPTMDGWDEEQVNRVSKELERMKTLNRRQSLELHTMSQNLVRVGSLIQSAQQQLLTEQVEQEENDNVSGHKLSGSVSLEATSSTMSSGIPFPFKSRRGLDFSWLLLLFSPEKKANLGERSSRSKRLAFLRPILRSSSSSSSALTDGSRKAVGCWACTRSSSRLDSSENI